MEWIEFTQYFMSGNRFNVQFVRSDEQDVQIGAALVALANAKGGDLFVGFDVSNCQFVGITRDEVWWTSYLKSHCRPLLDVSFSVIERHSKSLLHMRVSSGEKKPYYFQSKCYVMDDTKPVLALFEEEKFMREQSGEVTADSLVYSQDTALEKELSYLEESCYHEALDIPEDEDEKVDRVLDELYAQKKEVIEKKESVDNDLCDDSPEQVYSHSFQIQGTGSDHTYIVQNDPNDSEHEVRAVKVVTSEGGSEKSLPRLNVKKILMGMGLNKRQLKVVNFLQVNDTVQNKEYREMFNVSHKTAHLELSDLVNRELLKIEGAGRSTCYELDLNFHDVLRDSMTRTAACS